MFRLTRVANARRERILAAGRSAPTSCPELLTLADGPLGGAPKGFAHDILRSHIGHGQSAFAAARDAFQEWKQFGLGWVSVADPLAAIAPGETVAIEVRAGGLWSINFNRIIDFVDTPTRFGFLYATTALHVEQGQERFVIEFDPRRESVSYLIEAISRPRHVLARIAHPFSRAMQRRFARDSHARMHDTVSSRA